MGSEKSPDYILASIAVFLILLGILLISGISASFSQKEFGSPISILYHQILYGLIPGLILGIIAFKLPLSFLKRISPALFGISLLGVGLVFFPKIGLSAGGASRWLNLGPFSFQPSEFLKLITIIYFAAWLSSKATQGKRSNLGKIILKKASPKSSLPILVSFLVIIGLISFLLSLQPDISTSLVIIAVAGIMYFSAAETPLWHIIFSIFLGAGALFSLIKIAPYRMARLLVFLNPGIDPLGKGYQIKQSLISIGSGGIFGKGLGLSLQKFGLLPKAMSDSIFAIFGEEAGFIGSSLLVILFLLFLWRGIKSAKRSQNEFSRLLTIGITYWIIIQGLVNIGSMVGVLPLTGIPLPFISYGGSHLVVELTGMGILLNLSRS